MHYCKLKRNERGMFPNPVIQLSIRLKITKIPQTVAGRHFIGRRQDRKCYIFEMFLLF